MGIDYTCELAVGFVITHETLAHLVKKGSTTIYVVSGTEVGYDENEPFTAFEMAVHAIAELVATKSKTFSDGYFENSEWGVVGPGFQPLESPEDYGRVSVGALSLLSVVMASPELARIGAALREMGLDVGEPRIVIGCSVS